jgi:response regulator RpfG family c-di-GMP phosphodiesterase
MLNPALDPNLHDGTLAPRAWDSSNPDEMTPLDSVMAAGVLLDVSRIMSGLLGVVRPEVGARTDRVTQLVRGLVTALDLPAPWEFEVAARLSQIGWLTVPAETIAAVTRGEPLGDEQWRAVASHPLIARDLLDGARRLSGVREMIARQREPFLAPGESALPWARRDRLTVGGQVLRVCGEYDDLRQRGLSPAHAVAALAAQPCEFDPILVDVLATTH